MRVQRQLLFCVVAMLAIGPAYGDESSGWATDLDAAKQKAAASGKMVLVHFWAPWCAPCMQLDRAVLSKPTVIADLGRHLVPVKLNVDQHEATAEKYGVKSLPCDVIITPQGELVKLVSSPRSAAAYVGQLTEIAVDAKQAVEDKYAAKMHATADVVAQPAAEAAAPPRDTTPQMSDAMPASSRTEVAETDDRYDRPATTIAAPYERRTAAHWTGGTARATDSPDEQPGVAATPADELEIAAADTGSLADLYDRPLAGAPPANASSRNISAAPQQNGSTIPPRDTVEPRAPLDSAGPPESTLPPAGVRPAPVSRPVAQQLPPGNPPLGLDGFCPVHLAEGKKWLRGDTRYGAIHRGRTYLFGSEACQKKFLAEPDRFSPVMQGNDVIVALESGQNVAGRREFGVFYGDRVYLFANPENRDRFEKEHQRLADAAAKLVK